MQVMIEHARRAAKIYARFGGDVLALRASYHLGMDRLYAYWLSRLGFEPCTLDSELEVIRIRPDELEYTDVFSFVPDQKEAALTGTASGGWDWCRRPFEDTIFYRSMERRFVDGAAWEDTEMFRYGRDQIERGYVQWRSRTVDELRDRFCGIDELYDSIAVRGLRTQLELYESSGGDRASFQDRMGDLYVPDELRVAIGRNGELIRMTNGKHRMSIAKLLGCDRRVPAIVQFEHAEYRGDPYDVEILSPEHPLYEPVDGSATPGERSSVLPYGRTV